MEKIKSIEILNIEFHKFIKKRSGIINSEMTNYFADKFINAIIYDIRYKELKKHLKNVLSDKTKVTIKYNKLNFKDC